MTNNGMEVLKQDVWKSSWVLGFAMFIALLVAIFITYRKPRKYLNLEVNQPEDKEDLHLTKIHILSLAAAVFNTCCTTLDKFFTAWCTYRFSCNFWIQSN